MHRPTRPVVNAFLSAALILLAAAAAQAVPRDREPNSVYAERRAKLRAQLDGPVVLFGFTGRENSSPSYVFNQEENFYYLTGFNAEGAALLLVPEAPDGKSTGVAAETLFLQPRNLDRERWDGPRIGPSDPDVSERTGFSNVKAFAQLKGELEKLGKTFPNFYTFVPRGENEGGYPHARNWQNWLYQSLPNVTFKEVRPAIAALRQIKSPSEIELMRRVTEVSIDAHLEAMRMMHPGVHEYEVASRMEYIHKRGGCEGEAYAPIVGSGFFSTVLHYNDNGRKIEDGDVIVLDVGGQCSGYAADITRTLPANGAFTPRQREIYEIVLGAQNAVLAALKPGVYMGRGRNTPNDAVVLQQIAMDYMNSRGTDRSGRTLGRYFIHGLGHHVGLNVHDPSAGGPLEPGMIVTIEPGIYIPEENLGVRIEDMALITETGYELLTRRLPRSVEEIEARMVEASCRVGDYGFPPQFSAQQMARLGLSKMRVPFSRLANQARIQGSVRLVTEFDSGGKLLSAKAQEGHSLLKAVTEEALADWEFRPGAPTPKTVLIEFSLSTDPLDPVLKACVPSRHPQDLLFMRVIHFPRVEQFASQ